MFTRHIPRGCLAAVILIAYPQHISSRLKLAAGSSRVRIWWHSAARWFVSANALPCALFERLSLPAQLFPQQSIVLRLRPSMPKMLCASSHLSFCHTDGRTSGHKYSPLPVSPFTVFKGFLACIKSPTTFVAVLMIVLASLRKYAAAVGEPTVYGHMYVDSFQAQPFPSPLTKNRPGRESCRRTSSMMIHDGLPRSDSWISDGTPQNAGPAVSLTKVKLQVLFDLKPQIAPFAIGCQSLNLQILVI